MITGGGNRAPSWILFKRPGVLAPPFCVALGVHGWWEREAVRTTLSVAN